MARSGYTKVGGSAEKYRVNKTGEIISRRQYDNRRFQDYGWKSRSEYENRYKSPTYTYMAAQAIVNKGVSRKELEHPDSLFSHLALRAKRQGWGKDENNKRSRSVDGAMAKLLVYVGLRDPNADYPVGDSPPRKR